MYRLVSVACMFVMLLGMIFAGGAASGPYSPQDKTDTQESSQFEKHANFDATAKWPKPSIYVCWENPSSTYQSEMAMVRKAVASTWEAASALRFTGWQKCAENNKGIRILIEDSGPHTKGLGVRLDGKRDGMVLNFTFNNWSTSCKSMRDYCTETIAVHEFGHAIGLAHEQNRADAPGECQELRQGGDGTLLLTPYDPDSIMNYCNPKHNNDGKLSKYDAEAVKSVYGPRVEASRPVPRRKQK